MGIPGEPSSQLHRRQGVINELGAAKGDQLGVLRREGQAVEKTRRLRRQQPRVKDLRAKGLRAQGFKKLVLGGNDRGGNRRSCCGCAGASPSDWPIGSTRERCPKSRRAAA
jgi:hypothetical protein